MNALIFTRIAFVACSTFVGYRLGMSHTLYVEGAMVGFVISLLFVLLELGTDILPAKKLFMAAVGLMFGLLLAQLVARTIPKNYLGPESGLSADSAQIICNLVFGYFGVVFALKNSGRLDLSGVKLFGHSFEGKTNILDTSVIIDGRIKDLIMTHFISGTIVVPSFVLLELQALADSRDSRKRLKGRRGLETLEMIKTFDAKLTIYEQDYPAIQDVDLKLIPLAKDINGELLTTDFNLYKIALLHQVRALNLNELTKVLKPVANIGETVRIYVSKEGKEPGQGVGYLEDGTMVVVDDGAYHMRQEIECVVTQILQTSAGRMLFAKPFDDEPPLAGYDKDEAGAGAD